MNHTGMKFMIVLFAAAALTGAWGDDEAKRVTVIKSQSSADGSSQVREELLEECIVSLPGPDALQAIVESSPVYLKEINGDLSKNEFVKTYSASVEIQYMLYQKALIIVTTNSIEGKEPTMKMVEKNIKKSITFTSNPSEGDIYAGRSNRQYYFSSSEAAVADAKKRASVWLNQQAPVVCKNK